MLGNRHLCFLTILTLLLAAAGSLEAGDGTNSGNFLRIPVSSRGSALNDAYTALAEGTAALFYNPAGIAGVERTEFSVTHTELYQDLRLENASVAVPLGGGYGLGLATTYMGYGEIAGYDANGNSTGGLTAYSTVVTIGLSRKFSDIFAVGVAVKPIFEELGGYTARTVAYDLGVSLDWGRFALGAQVANLGGGLEYIDESTSLPRSFRTGIAYRSLGGASTVGAAFTMETGGDLELSGGAEYSYNQSLVFRASYCGSVSGKSSGGSALGLGVGLNLNPLRIDYSYRPAGDLNETHQITATFHIGR